MDFEFEREKAHNKEQYKFVLIPIHIRNWRPWQCRAACTLQPLGDDLQRGGRVAAVAVGR